MLQVARLAPNQLHEASDRVVDFLQSQFNEDGGVRGRSEASDLYYTVFGLDALNAFQTELPTERTLSYLEGFGDGDALDIVHLACLVRCHAAVGPGHLDRGKSERILERIEGHRTGDGGYAATPGADQGTVYHAFLALGAYQDAGAEMPHADRLMNSLSSLQTSDGAYSNDASMRIGTTPTTAAAATLLRQTHHPVPPRLGEWLRDRAVPAGGFLAMPEAPMPDLLSTATALHALAGMQVDFADLKDACLDFVDTLWTGQGFCGHWADDTVDVEYTFYALLALGHLSL